MRNRRGPANLKGIYKIPTNNIIFNDRILNAFPLRSAPRQRYMLSLLSFKLVFESLPVQ